MAHPGFGAAPQPHYYPQAAPAPAPQRQDDASRMANIYHQLGQLDPERRFPLDLIHILVKCASRDPAIALEVDYAIQRQFSQPPVGLPPAQMGSQMGPPMANAHMHAPSRPQHAQFGVSGMPATFNMSSATLVPSVPAAVFPATAAASTGAAAMARAAFRPSSSAAAVNRVVPPAVSRKRPAANETAAPPPPSRRIRTKESVRQLALLRGSQYRRFIRRDDNPSEEEVDRRLSRFMDSIVEDEDEYNRSQMRNFRKTHGTRREIGDGDTPPDSEEDPTEDSSIESDDGEEAVEAEEVTEAEPLEPREKPARYDKLIEQTKKDLGWYGKYAKVNETREKVMAYGACVTIGERLGKLARAVATKHRSYANRLHALTVMRDIIQVCLQKSPEPTRAPWTVRNCDVWIEVHFLEAVRALTPEQRRKVCAEGRGAWMRRLLAAMRDAHKAFSYPKLHDALVLLDPVKAKRVDSWRSVLC